MDNDFLVMLNHQCYEIPSQKKIDSFEIYHEQVLPRNLVIYHEHDYCELYFVLKGSVIFYADGKEYNLQEYDIFIVDAGVLHQQLVNDYNELDRIIIWINKDYFINDSFSSLYYSSLIKTIENTSIMHLKNTNGINQDIFLSLFKLEKSTKKIENIKSQQSLSIFKDLVSCILKLEDSKFPVVASFKHQNDKILDIINYINDNLKSDITIDVLASKFYLSKFYLMRKFTDEVGCTIHKYLTLQRIRQAKRLLSEGVTVERVYSDVGFKDYSTFSKAFKKVVGISPGKYKS